MDYRDAGVDIEKGDRIVAGIKRLMGESGSCIGHFGGAIPLPCAGRRNPLLVSSIDGVGTKATVASVLGRYADVGRDLVHHSINDIAVCGAEPLFFLDYIAMGRMDEESAIAAVGGIIKTCQRWGIALVGGETAEMPGVYRDNKFDLVGSITGCVEADEFIDGHSIQEGDWLIGFPSTGLHTNGYSLARQVLHDAAIEYDEYIVELGSTVGDALLAEHRCYLDVIRILKKDFQPRGLAHITGGGLEGNTKRIIPTGLKVVFDWGNWYEPPIFDLIQRIGEVLEEEMRHTFNLGIGLVAILSPVSAQSALDRSDWEFPPVLVGKVVKIT
ncbi:MAG: phosphoribosylformylglycinamidine cyclo-ligase [Calditrichaeota bacterium]|nr:phosphoribosylformylglycinamidine cyclo-ligase [Calditrichota bacterium]